MAPRSTSNQSNYDLAMRLGLPSYASSSAQEYFGLKPKPKPTPKPSGNIVTDPAKVVEEDSTPYGNQPKPLSADALRALGQRRLAADQAYQSALAGESSGIARFKASFNAAKDKMTRAARDQSEDLARKLAGKGLARNPMQMGRGVRKIESNLQDALGEAKFTMSTEIEALQLATQQAKNERDQILADIELEEAMLRSNPDLYFNEA